MEVNFEFSSKVVETIAPSWPKIGQLRLILIIGYIVLFAWLISLYAAVNHSEFDEIAWCIEWNNQTINEWSYSKEWGCIRLESKQ